MYIRGVIKVKATISKGILLFDFSITCFPWFNICNCSTHILWFTVGFGWFFMVQSLHFSCSCSLKSSSRQVAEIFSPACVLKNKVQTAHGVCVGCSQLSVSVWDLGICVSDPFQCAEMIWLVITFPYLRISFREGNTGRQKVPEAVCSTVSLIFLASYTKQKSVSIALCGGDVDSDGSCPSTQARRMQSSSLPWSCTGRFLLPCDPTLPAQLDGGHYDLPSMLWGKTTHSKSLGN